MTESMTLNEVLVALADAFPKQTIERNTFRVYMEDLGDLPVPAVEQAAVALRRESKFFPTIAEIREAVSEQLLGLPSEADALAMVEARGATKDLHPLVAETFKLVGGHWAWKTTDEPAVIRGQFMRLYRERRAAMVRAAQLDAALLPHPSRPALTA